MPKVIIALQISEGDRRKAYLSRVNQREMSRSPRPTTVKPMTDPAENATRRPRSSPVRQALAVRALERVAIRMPIKPDRAEKKPPDRKANGTNGFNSPHSAITPRIRNSTPKNTATIRYCRFR